MNYSKKRWLVLIASCFINLCIGSLYAWSVFAGPMAEHLTQLNGVALTPANLSIVFIIANSVGPVTMIGGGKVNDTFGPKIVIFVGGLMFGGGMILSGFAKSVGALILSYGLLTGLGLGMVYGCTISNSIKFFPDKRGFVGGVTTALFGISSVIIPPIAAVIISQTGATAGFKIIGAVFTVIVCTSAFFIDKCPVGFVPEGWTPPVSNNKSGIETDKDWKKMLQTPVFYVMLLLLTCGGFAALMFIPLAAPLAKKLIGMSPVAATAAVSTIALFNVFGRVLAGSISDKIGRINTLASACVLSIIGSGFLYVSGEGDITTFYIGISIIGICFGSFMGVFPGFTADQFGARNNSVNFGIMFIGFAIAGYVGPTIMVKVAKMTNSAFLIAMGFSFAGLILTFIYRVVNKSTNNVAVSIENKL
ncbi:L-lactate MFS transporter [Ilyobacter polytropus]|uniref:Major facilitator superfamily MFS_1 n=1 Tax=Ilyobacter polytropus (strain ATCC 51220 / DSM 2926 / LMG 16218 / CuHBu1) TaxID=572544 RepID=E3H9M3_ILYPC|nr:OFA family MFS transporter [Ilyobacter polytropus]ADO83412.1 major facilitator superfamily MFS_1 [Ilyobacter polytropus DSM 2926]